VATLQRRSWFRISDDTGEMKKNSAKAFGNQALTVPPFHEVAPAFQCHPVTPFDLFRNHLPLNS
jgi:hypothetical protein